MRRSVIVLLLPVLAACGTAAPAATGVSPIVAASTVARSIAAASTAPAHDGFPDAAFRVAPPSLPLGGNGPGVASQPPCSLKEVSATAVTRVAAGGVVGVIHLTGHRCSLPIPVGPTALLDGHGKALGVRLDATPPEANPPQNWRPDIALTYGNALWGFAWRGSWCGSAATSVVIPMVNDSPTAARHPYLSVIAPLRGPEPPCSRTSDAVLQPGAAGAPADRGNQQDADAVLPAPTQLEWPAGAPRRLPPSRSAARTGDARLTVVNATNAPIDLSPCPDYVIEVGLRNRDMYGTVALPCATHPTLGPHDAATFDLPTEPLRPRHPGAAGRRPVHRAGQHRRGRNRGDDDPCPALGFQPWPSGTCRRGTTPTLRPMRPGGRRCCAGRCSPSSTHRLDRRRDGAGGRLRHRRRARRDASQTLTVGVDATFGMLSYAPRTHALLQGDVQRLPLQASALTSL